MGKKVIIIGAGASGMMAAITAARMGAQVTLIEHKDRIGKKILATGNGKCNFTNMDQKKEYYRSNSGDTPWNIISKFDNNSVLDFFKELGIYPKIRNGYVYPNSGQASSVLDALRVELEYLHVNILTETDVTQIQHGEKIKVITADKGEFMADSLIIACGSKASPTTGSDGSGYKMAKKLGHTVIRVLPGLVQLKSPSPFFKAVKGVRTDGEIKITEGKNVIAKDTGELMLTDYGISGIPAFQVSRYVSNMLSDGKKVTAVLDFLPELDFSDLKEYIRNRIHLYPDKTIIDNFNGLLNKKLIQALLKEAGYKENQSTFVLEEKDIVKLAGTFKSFKAEINGTNSYDSAQVCCGGIPLSEVDPDTLESKIKKGVYFAGEILDVDGICGGYNLQWAWSSGYVAGINAAK